MAMSLAAPAFYAGEIPTATSAQTETSVQTEASAQPETAAETAAQTEKPQTETAAQTPETASAETSAQPETAAAGTEAGQTQPETAAAGTEAGQTQPETASAGTEAGQTQPETQASTDSTEKTTETEKTEKTSEKRPAFTADLSAGGIGIHLEAKEGVFPEGTKAAAIPVSSQTAIDAAQNLFADDLVVDAAAVDISFYYDGKEIEPDDSNVRVTLSLNGEIDGEDQHVVHIKDNGTAEEMNVARVDDSSAAFDADSFSIYAIVGTDAVTRRTYRFYNGDQLVDTQIVKNGDTLEEPGKPEKDGCVFTGWTDKDGKDFTGFGTISDIPEHAADETVNLHAQFTAQFHVIFHDQNGKVITIKTGKTGDVISTTDVDVELPVNNYIHAWTTSSDMTESGKVGESVTLDKQDIALYPLIGNICWVFFHGNEGTEDPTEATKTEPVYTQTGGTVAEPAAPTRDGYTFGGWYRDEACTGDAFDFASHLQQNTDLYAKWVPAATKYNVLVWKETLVDGAYVAGNYTRADSFTIDGTSGDIISQSQIDEAAEKFAQEQTALYGRTQKKSYYHYDFNQTYTDSQNQNAVITGNGSATVNVYFDLHPYTVSFHAYNGPWRTLSASDYDVQLTANGATTTDLTFTYRLDETIPEADLVTAVSAASKKDGSKKAFTGWVILQKAGGVTYNFMLYSAFPLKRISQDTLIRGMDIKYYATFSQYDHTDHIREYYENIDDDGYSIHDEYDEDSTTGGDEVQSARTGFTIIDPPEGYPVTNSSTRHYYFYYKRRKYNLYFYNNGALDSSAEQIKYETPLAAYGYTPDKPAGMDDDYTFDGWVDEAGKPVDFSSMTMPAKNLFVYAKWKIRQVDVTFDSNGGSAVETQRINSGSTASKPADPTREGYTFAGWVTENGSPYSFSTVLKEDTTLYARWISISSIRIIYDAGSGSGAPVDSSLYKDISKALILGAPAASPDNKYFIGWKTESGDTDRLYQKGDIYFIRSENAQAAGDGTYNICFTAVYSERKPAELTYFANNGTDQKTQVVLPNNSGLTLANAGSLLFSFDGYRFAGWNTKADGSGTAYAAGDIVAIDYDAPNVLYAQWEKIPETETETETETEPETAEPESEKKKTEKSSETESETEKAVKTGDDSHPELYLLFCLLAGGAVLTCGTYGRKRRGM